MLTILGNGKYLFPSTFLNLSLNIFLHILKRKYVYKKFKEQDPWVAQLVKRLPSDQVMISGSWGEFPSGAPCSAGESTSPSLPATALACGQVLSCQINKILKINK